MTEPNAQPRLFSHANDLVEELHTLLGTLRRGWRVIALSVAVCLTVAVIVVASSKRIYQATARLLIVQQGGRPLNVTNNNTNTSSDNNDDYIPTHVWIVKSPLVIQRAIDQVGLAELPSLIQKSETPVRVAIENLTVTRPDRLAKVLQLDYRAYSRAESETFLAAIIESYQKFLETRYQRNNSEVVTLITKAREGLKAELEKLQEEYLAFHRENPSLITDETGRAFVVRRLEQWDHAASEAHIRMVQLKMQLTLGQKLVRGGTGLWAMGYALSQFGGESNGAMLAQEAGSGQALQTDYIRQLLQQQQQLAERYGPQFSKVRELQDQVVRIQERMRDTRSRIDSVESAELLGAIEESLKATEAMREEFKSKFAEDLAEAKSIENDLLTEAGLKESLDRERALFNTVVDQLKQAQMAGDFNSISSEAIEPSNALKDPVRPRVTLTLALALLAGSFLGAGIVVVSDRFCQQVQSAEEMKRILDLTVLGLIPRLSREQAAHVDALGQISHTLPRSLMAEAFKAARTNVEVIRRNRTAQVILVTSPMAHEGKSTVASNLAISLAQGGRSVLLIDADLRCPTQHTVHKRERSPGLVQVLAESRGIEELVQETVVDGLKFLAAGCETPNPAELLMSARFGAVIAEARRHYDVIIVDSPPILMVTDSAIAAAAADGIMLVVRVGQTKRQNVQRALEILKELGTPILGTVINAIGFESGQYGYGYGYGYGVYGYGRPSRTTPGLDTPLPVPAPHTSSQPRAVVAGAGCDHNVNGTPIG
jgi:capsular exopolysaccharide synthesis family protein